MKRLCVCVAGLAFAGGATAQECAADRDIALRLIENAGIALTDPGVMSDTGEHCRLTGVALSIPAAKIPARRLEISRGCRSWASVSPFRCASKPCTIVTRSFAMRSRQASGSKVAVSTCLAPVMADIIRPSENPKA